VEKSVGELVSEVLSHKIGVVCVTGGEPMLQRRELSELAAKLEERGCRIVLETNGSLYDKKVFGLVDAVACDMKPPSSGEKSDEKILAKLRPKDYVKVVVADEVDFAYARKIAAKSPVEVFLQPAAEGKLKWLARKALKEKIGARVLPQLHKIMGVK
jgi:7-carboxy-7-deazaguanine synthase